MNPALRSTNSTYVGLPVFSGMYVGVNNNFINFSDIFSKEDDSGYTIFSSEAVIDRFAGNLNKKNSINSQFSIPLVSVGFKGKNSLYYFIDINERIESNSVLPGDLIKLMLKGNGAFVGDKADFSSARMNFRYYHELGFTVSKNVSNNLRLGIRPKILVGVFSSSARNKSLSLSINNDYTHTLEADVTANFSGPFIVNVNADNKFESIKFDDNWFNSRRLTDIRNFGFALDMGAEYTLINNKIKLSAALTDLGFIKWNRNATNLSIDGLFVFDGIEISEEVYGDKIFEKNVGDLVGSFQDSINFTKTERSFTTALSSGLTVGGSYNLNKNISFGLLSYTRFIGKQAQEALTLSANLNLPNAPLSFSLAYSLQNRRADNFGAGLAFRLGFVQLYAVSDRIPVTFYKLTNNDSKAMIPANWNTVNLRFGLNLTFGNKPKVKSKTKIKTPEEEETIAI